MASGDEGLVEDWALEQRLLSHYLMDLQRSRQPCPALSPPTAPGSHRERICLNRHTEIKSFQKLKKVNVGQTCFIQLNAEHPYAKPTERRQEVLMIHENIKVQKENLNCSSRGRGRCSGAEGGVGMGLGRGVFERAKQTAAKPAKRTRKWEH